MAKGNSFTLRGNAVADSEQVGNGPVKFSVAWNQARKVGDEWETTPHYFDVICWDREVVVSKGQRVLLNGYITQQRWQTDDGQNRSKVVLVADEVASVEKPGSESAPATGDAPQDEIDF